MNKILGFKVVANIALWVVLIGVVVFTFGFGSCLYITRNEITKEVDKKIDSDMAYVENYVDGQLQRVEDVAYTLVSSKFGKTSRNADGIGVVAIDPETFVYPSEEEVFQLLEHFLEANPFICGLAMGFEKSEYPDTKGEYGFAAYVTNVSGKSERLKLGEIHDYHQKEWYKQAFSSEKAYWSRPFNETSRGKVVACFSIPLHGYDNKLIGVLALDIATEAFRQKCIEATPFPNAEVTLTDREFRFICHPNTDFLLKRIDEVGIYDDYKVDESMKNKMLNKEGGKYTVNADTDNETIFYVKTLKRTGWTLSIECPTKDIYSGVDRMKSITRWIAFFSILFMLVCFIWLFRNLQKVTVTKAGIERDLSIASNIQMGMIPKLYPAFPNRKELDVYGYIQPAKSVGGDLYDYFIRDDKFFFCIGDVSGKGVPASLFMAVVRALFRNVSLHADSPSVIAGALNQGLAEGNEMSMFCTMFIGVIDLKTGSFEYCNAGHNAPVVRRITENGLDVSYMESQGNIAIGVFEGFEFKSSVTTMKPGEALFLYTDGVTEAENIEKQLFGEKALLDALASVRARNACTSKDFVESVCNSIIEHTRGAEQSDDITILLVEYRGYEENL